METAVWQINVILPNMAQPRWVRDVVVLPNPDHHCRYVHLLKRSDLSPDCRELVYVCLEFLRQGLPYDPRAEHLWLECEMPYDALSELPGGLWEQQCPICMKDYEEPVRAPTCPHVFCRSCLGNWLNQAPTCPLCQQAINQLGRVVPGELELSVPPQPHEFMDGYWKTFGDELNRISFSIPDHLDFVTNDHLVYDPSKFYHVYRFIESHDGNIHILVNHPEVAHWYAHTLLFAFHPRVQFVLLGLSEKGSVLQPLSKDHEAQHVLFMDPQPEQLELLEEYYPQAHTRRYLVVQDTISWISVKYV